MFRCRFSQLHLTALVLALAALLWMGTPGFVARAEANDSALDVQVSVRPEGLIAPGDVMLSFIIENVSGEEARNVYLSSSDGLLSEPVGQIAPGESQSFSRQHSVTEEELEAGEIVYTISYDDPSDSNVKINHAVRAQIRRSDALPDVEFTRQFSSRSAEQGGTVTITYRVRNTGNVALYDLQVQDSLGDFFGRMETLDVGESRTLINRVTIDESTVSSAALSYRTDNNGELLTQTLADTAVTLAGADMQGVFTIGYSAFSKSTADVVLMLTNEGNVGYRDLCVTDDLYGGVIADELVLPAGGDPLEISRAYSVRGSEGFRWRVTGTSETGEKVSFVTETLTLSPREEGARDALSLSVRALTPRISRAGDVTVRVTIENPGGVEARDLVFSEPTLGDIHTFAVLPADGVIQRDFTIRVNDDATYDFTIHGTDADGESLSASAAPVEVSIAPDGVLPQGTQQGLFEFSGGSIKIGGSSTFAVLLLVGCAVLLTLIVILIIATRRARLERQLKIAAEKQRRREEMGKTNRFSPVRAPQKTKSKGRNT